MNIDKLTTKIESQRSAWKALHEAQAQVQENQAEIRRAEAKCADLRANDEGDVAKLAKALTEQAGIIEIAKARDARLRENAAKVQAETERLSVVTVSVLCDARDALLDYRHHLRVTDMVKEFRSWVSPDTFKARADWLKFTISELAWEDQRFDEASALVEYKPREFAAKQEDQFEANAKYLEARKEELQAAFEHVAQREAYLAGIRAKNQIPPLHNWQLINLEAA